jgi:hypothetical protein
VTAREREPNYQLGGSRPGGGLFGLDAGQVALLAAGFAAMVALSAASLSATAVAIGVTVAIGCAGLALLPWQGRPAYAGVPVVTGFALRALRRRQRWMAPLPLLTGTPPAMGAEPPKGGSSPAVLPAFLDGIKIVPVERPRWAGGASRLEPVGIAHDRIAGAWTAVLPVRGGPFALLDPTGQHQALAAWAELLSQFARESSPVLRLGWSIRSAPAQAGGRSEPPATGGGMTAAGNRRATASYRALLGSAVARVATHDPRVWISLDGRRLARRASNPPQAALAAARVLADRARAAGLTVGEPLSPVELAETVRVQLDPSLVDALAGVRRGLSERTGLASPLAAVHAGPLSVDVGWDAVRVDDGWHRLLWVAQWPMLGLAPSWLDPLLLDVPCARTVTVLMEPVPARLSRRRITAESASIDTQITQRDQRAFRVPVQLARAHADLARRESELAAGFPEYGYLALIDVTAQSPAALDDGCAALTDLAARCGITELRPLHGRHDHALAVALALGRAPGRPLLGGTR